MNKFAGAEIQTHDHPTHFVLFQSVPFMTAVLPLSDLTSLTPSGGRYSGGPAGHCTHMATVKLEKLT